MSSEEAFSGKMSSLVLYVQALLTDGKCSEFPYCRLLRTFAMQLCFGTTKTGM